MNANFISALRTTGASVLVKILMLGAALILFLGLRQMNDWHESFALSDAWQRRLEEHPRPWTPTLIATARAEPARDTYRSPDDLFAALAARIEKSGFAVADDPVFAGYDANRKALADVTARSAEAVEHLQAGFENDWREYDCLSEELEHDSKRLTALHGNAAAKLSERIAKLSARRAAIHTSITDRTALRRQSDAWYQPRIAELRATIQDAKSAMRKDFDAAHVSARPVPAFFAKSQAASAFLLDVGDSHDALHSLYTAVWYGLQVIVAILFFRALLPLLLGLGAAKDKEGAFAKVRKWLGDAFSTGSRATPVVAAAAAAGLTLAAMQPLAGQTFHTDPPSYFDEAAAGATGRTGSRGERGRQGDAGAAGERGERGLPGETPKLPDDLDARLRDIGDLQKLLDELRGELTAAKGRVQAIENEQLPTRTTSLEVVSAATTDHVTRLTDLSGTFTSIAGQLTEIDRGLVAQQETIERSLATQLPAIAEQAASASTAAIESRDEARSVNASMVAYGKHVDDLLDQNAVWDDRGFWRAIIPLRQYAAGPAAIQIVQHDLAAHGYDQEVQANVAAALRTASAAQRYRWRFEREVIDAVELMNVEATMKTKLRAAVDETLPLILKVCRVPR